MVEPIAGWRDLRELSQAGCLDTCLLVHSTAYGCARPGRRPGSPWASLRKRGRGWRLAYYWPGEVRQAAHPHPPAPMQMPPPAALASQAKGSIVQFACTQSSWAQCQRMRVATEGCLPHLPGWPAWQEGKGQLPGFQVAIHPSAATLSVMAPPTLLKGSGCYLSHC